MCIKLLIVAQRIRNHTMFMREHMRRPHNGILCSYVKEGFSKGYEMISYILLHTKKEKWRKVYRVCNITSMWKEGLKYTCTNYTYV